MSTMEMKDLAVNEAIRKMRRYVKTASSTDANAGIQSYIDLEIYMFVTEQMDKALQWLQSLIENLGIGEGCCNDILTTAWLRQAEIAEQSIEGGVRKTKELNYTSIRDADSARVCLVDLGVELHDRLVHYRTTGDIRDYWVQQLQYLQGIKLETSAEDDDTLEQARWMVDRSNDDLNMAWDVVAKSWTEWHPYLTIFLQASDKFFEQIDIESVSKYEYTCLCLIYLSHSVIRKAQFADTYVAMHCSWIDECKALLKRLERFRHERASSELRSHYELSQNEFQDKYQKMIIEQLEEEIERFGFKDSLSLFEQIVFFKVLNDQYDCELV